MALSHLKAEGGEAGALLAPVLPALESALSQDEAPFWAALRADGDLRAQWQEAVLRIARQVAVVHHPERQRLTLIGFLLETLEMAILQRYFTPDSPFPPAVQADLALRLAPDQDPEHYRAASCKLVWRLQATYWVLRQWCDDVPGLDYYERLFATFAHHGYRLMLAQEGPEAQTLARQLGVVQESVEVLREQLLEGGVLTREPREVA